MEAKLKEAAKIILRDKFEEFTRMYEAFLNDSESIENDKELSRLVGDGEELEPDDFLWAFAVTRRCIGWIDWKGEEEEGQLTRFVDERMQSLGKMKLDWKFLKKKKKSID